MNRPADYAKSTAASRLNIQLNGRMKFIRDRHRTCRPLESAVSNTWLGIRTKKLAQFADRARDRIFVDARDREWVDEREVDDDEEII